MQAVSTSLSTVFTAVIFSSRSSVDPKRTTPPAASSASRSVDTDVTVSGMRSATAAATVSGVAGVAVEPAPLGDGPLDAGEHQRAGRDAALPARLGVVPTVGGLDGALLDGDDVAVGVDERDVLLGDLHRGHDLALGHPHPDGGRPRAADLRRRHPRQGLDPVGDRPGVEADQGLVRRHGGRTAHRLGTGAVDPRDQHAVDVEQRRPGGGQGQHHDRHHRQHEREPLQAAPARRPPHVDAAGPHAGVHDHRRRGGPRLGRPTGPLAVPVSHPKPSTLDLR